MTVQLTDFKQLQDKGLAQGPNRGNLAVMVIECFYLVLQVVYYYYHWATDHWLSLGILSGKYFTYNEKESYNVVNGLLCQLFRPII